MKLSYVWSAALEVGPTAKLNQGYAKKFGNECQKEERASDFKLSKKNPG